MPQKEFRFINGKDILLVINIIEKNMTVNKTVETEYKTLFLMSISMFISLYLVMAYVVNETNITVAEGPIKFSFEVPNRGRIKLVIMPINVEITMPKNIYDNFALINGVEILYFLYRIKNPTITNETKYIAKMLLPIP